MCCITQRRGEVIGNWMLEGLCHHGYEVSRGTLYRLLKRMEAHGWLNSTVDPARGPKPKNGNG